MVEHLLDVSEVEQVAPVGTEGPVKDSRLGSAQVVGRHVPEAGRLARNPTMRWTEHVRAIGLPQEISPAPPPGFWRQTT